jgi:hypothetical protein
MIEFEARLVVFDSDAETCTEGLYFAERDDDEGRVLEVQRGLEEATEQERRLGMDTYCVVDENQNTYYGGVARWRIARGRVELYFAPGAAQAFGAAGYVIRLPDEEAIETVRDHLPRILKGVSDARI